jgi:hypothetical protein
MKGISKQTNFVETNSTVQPLRKLLASCFNAFEYIQCLCHGLIMAEYKPR